MRLKIILQEIFYALTVALLVFSGLEFLFPRMVLSYLNINFVLLAWLFDVIILLVISDFLIKNNKN